MARKLRSETFEPNEIGVYHCMNRIVRRSFLCGWDPITKKDYSHRKKWFLTKLKRLSQLFAIDVMGYTVLSNHFHLVLRNRPDQVENMTDEEVALRWLLICPPASSRSRRKRSPTPSEAEISQVLATPDLVTELRTRLSNPSWLLRQLCQHMGIRCNAEDEMSGHFWESRFKMCRLLDEAAVLACLAYVDLNPLRAGLAEGLEDYPYVSIRDRLRTLAGEKPDPSSWLAPLELSTASRGVLFGGSKTQTKREILSLQLGTPEHERYGCLEISTRKYEALLKWLAQQSKCGAGNKPSAGQPFASEVLEQLGIEPEGFASVAIQFQECFSTHAGCPETLAKCSRSSKVCSLNKSIPNALQLERLLTSANVADGSNGSATNPIPDG